MGQGDDDRVRRLLVRGTKYANALVMVVGIPVFVFAEPLLVLWAGAVPGAPPSCSRSCSLGCSWAVITSWRWLLLGIGEVRWFTATTWPGPWRTWGWR